MANIIQDPKKTQNKYPELLRYKGFGVTVKLKKNKKLIPKVKRPARIAPSTSPKPTNNAPPVKSLPMTSTPAGSVPRRGPKPKLSRSKSTGYIHVISKQKLSEPAPSGSK